MKNMLRSTVVLLWVALSQGCDCSQPLVRFPIDAGQPVDSGHPVEDAGEPCDAGASPECPSPLGVCHEARSTCSNGAVVCADLGTLKAPGTPCGAGQVCSAGGVCVACDAGSACDTAPGAPCELGLVACGTGAPVCEASGPAPAGRICATASVCDGDGGCVACQEDAGCQPSNACLLGHLTCGGGSPVCVPAQPVAPGTSCGAAQVCDGDGGCVGCQADAGCVPTSNVCKVGHLGCSTGAPVCGESALPVDAGAVCGTNLVCSPGGTCVSCTAGVACATNPGNPCITGLTSCATGASACVDGPAAADGVLCAAGKKVCVSGTCSVLSSCQAVRTISTAAPTGVYTIDPDGAGSLAQYDAYCEMDTDDGGWTLVMTTDLAHHLLITDQELAKSTFVTNPTSDVGKAALVDTTTAGVSLAWGHLSATTTLIVAPQAPTPNTAMKSPLMSPWVLVDFVNQGRGNIVAGYGGFHSLCNSPVFYPMINSATADPAKLVMVRGTYDGSIILMEVGLGTGACFTDLTTWGFRDWARSPAGSVVNLYGR